MGNHGNQAHHGSYNGLTAEIRKKETEIRNPHLDISPQC